MKNIAKKLATVAFVLLATGPAFAGKGGSAAKIRDAVNSRSVDAIIAEVERAESLMCSECVDIMTRLTEDDRYAVREVAAWWFAKRPQLKDQLAVGFLEDLASGNTLAVRNAADFLGATITYTALPALRDAIHRDVGPDAKLALVRAAKVLGHRGGRPILTAAMSDATPAVRAAAVTAYRDIYDGARDPAPVVALLGDSDADVRAAAATVSGALKASTAVSALERLVVGDASSTVRSNAAWALGKLGSASSRPALTLAAADTSGLVRGVAKAALGQLR